MLQPSHVPVLTSQLHLWTMPEQPTEKRVAEARTPYSRNDNKAPSSNKTDDSKVSSRGDAGYECLLVALMVLDIPDEIAEEAVAISFEAEATTYLKLLPQEVSNYQQESMEDKVDGGTGEEVRTESGNRDETMLVCLIFFRTGSCTSSAKA